MCPLKYALLRTVRSVQQLEERDREGGGPETAGDQNACEMLVEPQLEVS